MQNQNAVRSSLPPYRVRCRELNENEQLVGVKAVIVISGAQAAGKTTLARRLANRLDYAVIDASPRRRHHFQIDASQALKKHPHGLIIEAEDVEASALVEDLVNGPPLHIHLRRAGDWILDTIGNPLAVNIVNAGGPENMEVDALAWLAGFGVAPAALSPAAVSPDAI